MYNRRNNLDARGDERRMEIQNPHDKFFKETLGNVETAKDFITNYLPEQLLNIMDINTLEPQKDSFINKELEENFSDLLFKVDICQQEGYLYLLFEHKSYPAKGIAFQLLRYMVEIWEAKRDKEQAKELPIIIPLVIYHGQQSWGIPSNLGELLNGYDQLPEPLKIHVPNFEFLLFDVSGFSDEEIKGTAQLKIVLTLFRDLKSEDAGKRNNAIFRSIYYLNELENQQTAVGYLETVLRYIFTVAKDFTKKEMAQMIREIETTQPKGSEVVMTLADILRQEGREEGMEKGMEIGGAKALSEVAILQLTDKFGALPKEMKEAIYQADIDSLKILVMNSYKFDRLDEVRRYIN